MARPKAPKARGPPKAAVNRKFQAQFRKFAKGKGSASEKAATPWKGESVVNFYAKAVKNKKKRKKS
jgi:hypothetical protein